MARFFAAGSSATLLATAVLLATSVATGDAWWSYGLQPVQRMSAELPTNTGRPGVCTG